jgi:Na+-driven multidrug efflux pump
VNIVLDWLFIVYWDLGISGAAWATMLSYIASFLYAAWFIMLSGKSEMRLVPLFLLPNAPIIREVAAIGSVTLARQGVVSLLAIVLNNALFSYGGEQSLSIWGIINRMMMFANFPVFGVTQGFLPIAGYNYGARKWKRVKEVIRVAVFQGTLIALVVFVLVMFFAPWIISVFTKDSAIVAECTPALRWVFLATPTLTLQLIGSAYYQAIGKARPAMLLTMTKQGFFLIPLILLLPMQFGILGVWLAFPIADGLTAIVNFIALRQATAELNSMPDEQEDPLRHLVP